MITIHILTAFLTLLTCLSAWVNPTLQKRILLRIGTILSLGSGVALDLEPGQFTRAFCIRLGVYLLIIMATEYKLYKSLGRIAPRTV